MNVRLGQIPAVILVTRIRPSLLVPTAEALWSVASFCCAAATTVPQLYGLRFLVGFFESFYFPVIVYLISSWYTKEERAKRVVLFYSTSTLASMFSGYLQAAAYKNLNGTLGHSGWQWLFIITGVISLGSSLLSYAFLPDWPETTRAFYLSSTEKAFARTRLVNYGYAPLGQSKWTRKKIFSIMKHWQFYVLPVGYLFVQSSLPSQQPVFNLWLKAEKYSVYDVNVLPTIAPGIAVIAQVVAGMLSDSPLLQGRRWEAITFLQAGTFFSVVVLAVWDVSHNLKFAAMCLTYMSAGVPGLYFAWFPELIPHDHEMRGFLVAFTNIFSYINQIWWSDAVWRTVHAPRFHSGFIGASIMGVCMVLTAVLMHLLEQRDRRTEKRDLDLSSENASEA
jgi:ACS family pantothenate transporter-like MFS transporter